MSGLVLKSSSTICAANADLPLISNAPGIFHTTSFVTKDRICSRSVFRKPSMYWRTVSLLSVISPSFVWVGLTHQFKCERPSHRAHESSIPKLKLTGAHTCSLRPRHVLRGAMHV